MHRLFNRTNYVNQLLARYGVKFGIYQNGNFQEQLFPFDVIPRIISADAFAKLEKGLIQRVTALNLFLKDIYGKRSIIKDDIIPEDFVFSSPGFLPQCDGFAPVREIYSHISGIDLVLSRDNVWYILEDNLRVPSGASYPMIARELCRRASPETFSNNHIQDNRNYADMLRETMNYVNTGGINVILTPGRYNAAYFEHSFLAEKIDAVLSDGNDLSVENSNVYHIDNNGRKQRVGALYRRISDDYLDPLFFNRNSLIGIPDLYSAYRKGNIGLLNAMGNGIADDKGIYYFVPKMIRYYLGEDALLNNAPTYLPFYREDLQYILDKFDNLVIKDVAEAGGYGVIFGNRLSREEKACFTTLLKSEPRRFIAQEVIDFQDIDILEKDGKTGRKADLRAFVLTGKTVRVWKSGLTRFSRTPGSFIVNSSQGGGFKDTWVLSH